MRKLLIGLAVLVVVIVAAAFVGPLFVPADSIKGDIAREVAKATGRNLAIDGSLKFRILPAPGVSATGVRLSNAADGSAPDMLRLKSAAVEVALFPLITGNIQVSRIVLSEPDILLEKYADGTNNWTFAPTSEAASSEPAGGDDAATGAEESQVPAVRFDNVVIEGGTLVFQTPDSIERIEDINVALGAASLNGPFRANGNVNARGFAIGVDAAIGELVDDRATPVNLRISTGGAEIDYSGVLAGAPDAARLSGQVEVRAEDLSALVAAFSNGPALAVLIGKPLEINGTLAASQTSISIDNLAFRLGDDSATGAVDVTLGDIPKAALVLNLNQLDLDRLLAAAPNAGAGGGDSNAGPSPTKDNASGQAGQDAAAPGAGFVLPKGFSATLETKIDAVVYRGGVVRQVMLNTELADGSLTISQAAAQFPGGANASVIGFVSTTDSVPKFEGQAELSADDFRALLQWAGVDVATVPQDRLRKMAGSLSIAATTENVTLTDIDVSVDVSRMRGGVAIAVRERLGFGIGLSLDKVNIDAYLPATQTPADAASGSAAANPSTNPSASDGKAPAVDSGPKGLAALDMFDAILQLKVGDVVFRDQRLSDINLDSTLQGGSLELRDLSVASLAGAKASVKGRVDGLASAPKADVTISLDARDGDRLLALAGVDAPAKLGATKLNGSLRGDLQDLNVDLTLDAMGASMRTAGSLGVLAVPPRYDMQLDIKHPDAAKFAARIRGEDAAGGPKLGALAASASLRGDLSASDIDTKIEVGPGEITARGRLSNLAAGGPLGNLAINASHPDMVAFARLLAPDYNPSKPDLGPFALKTDLALAANTMTLANLEGNAGPVGFKGSANIDTDGPRPSVVATLDTGEIVVDWFLPIQKGSGSATSNARSGGVPGAAASRGSATPAGNKRWSREPIELSGLRAADADIKLSAPAISYTNIRVDQPRLAIKLDDGVLDLSELSGQAFGGGFSMTGQVAARDVPTMRYAMRVENADAAKFLGDGASGERGVMSVLDLLFPVSNVELASGRLGADLDVTSRGRSEFEMISNLAGKGAMRFTDAVVDGVDVCQISDQLNRLNGIEGFLGLASSGRGGQTKIANFDGRFVLAKGIATLPQQQINAECAAVAFSGTTNLPEWTVDIQARAGFPAHPEFAGVVVEQKGPLDAPNTRLVNVNEINQFIVGKAAGSILRKLLPGATQEQAPPATDGGTTQPPPSSKPEDQFRNLLEGLIRGR